MSKSRIGPPPTPIAPTEASSPGQPRQTKPQREPPVADRLTKADTRSARTATERPNPALEAPAEHPAAERRARLGGDRGAWPARVRDGILFAANNPSVGQMLLDAYGRGVTTA